MYNYSPFGDDEENKDGGDQSYGNASQPRSPTTTNASGASARNTGLAAAASQPTGGSAQSGSLASVSSPVQGDDAAQQRAALNTNALLNDPSRSAGGGERVSVNDGSLAGLGSPLANNPNTGISGGMGTGISGTMQRMGSVPSMGAYAGSLAGFDSSKFGKDDPKYNLASVFSNFDPASGLTPDVIAQLNGLGIGQFSGQGDKLHVDNGSGAFNGVSNIDAVQGLHGGAPKWAYQPEDGTAPATNSGAQQSLMEDPVQLQLAQQLGVDTNSPYWKQVLQNLMDQMASGQTGAQTGSTL